MKIVIFNIILLAFVLSSCANQEKQFIIAPELGALSSDTYHGQQLSLKVIDMRASTHIAQILTDNEAAKLYSSQSPLDSVISEVMNKQLKVQGLELASQTESSLEIQIDNALITVQQELMKYDATSKITLRFIIKNSDKTLTKTFRSTTTSNRPFSSDIAVLERDFNQQLSNLLNQALNNAQIQRHIRKQK